MAAISHLLRALGAFFVIAALFAPATASAHLGHRHLAPVAASMMAASSSSASAHPTAAGPRTEVRNAVSTSTGGAVVPCSGHCCGSIACATCCSAALAPDVSVPPDRSVSSRLLIAPAQALLGLPPEALPKPPKSIV